MKKVGKDFYKSKVVWLNFFLLMVGLFNKDFFLAMGMSDVSVNKLMLVMLQVGSVLNLALRVLFTDGGINNPLGAPPKNGK